MADTPSDTTPEGAKTAPPPRRRKIRSDAGSTKPASGRGKGRAAAPRAVPAAAPAIKTAKRAAATAKTSATKAVRQVKPKVKAAAKDVTRTAKKAGVGTILAVGAAASLSVAAGVAAVLGRKKIAKVTSDTVDKVIGKDEPSLPLHPADRPLDIDGA